MLTANTWTSLLRLAVALALPTMACFSYYTLNDLNEATGPSPLLVSLAYPLAIVGVIGIAAIWVSKRRSPVLLILAAVCFALPTSLLIYLHLS